MGWGVGRVREVFSLNSGYPTDIHKGPWDVCVEEGVSVMGLLKRKPRELRTHM